MVERPQHKIGGAGAAHAPHDEGQHDHGHDHGHGASGEADALAVALAHADEQCRARGQRLTEMRRQVLAALIGSGQALGAYDLIEMVGASDKRPAPVAIYRALDFLREQGLVHRIESRNAFVACPHQHGPDETVIFFVCENCQRVIEESSQTVGAALALLARKRGFEAHANMLEIKGRCSSCRYVPQTA
jgi:Fur family zinc uptake transcriptional regulator